MRTWWAVLAALTTVMAGCSDGGGSGGESDDEAFDDLGGQATSTTGLIRGVVFDQAIFPIEGAKVAIKDAGKEVLTNEQGAFVIDELEPGIYTLSVSKFGYGPVQASAEVKAGVDKPAIVKVKLEATSVGLPTVTPLVFEGRIECQEGAALGPGTYAYHSTCSSSALAPLFPDDRFAVRYDIGTELPSFIQAEMDWKSTQTLSKQLAHNFHYPNPSDLDGQRDLTVSGDAPLTNRMDADRSKEYVEGLNYEAGEELVLRMRMFTRATDDFGVALTIGQDFTVYTHVFYNWTPEDDWRFITDGAPVPPS